MNPTDPNQGGLGGGQAPQGPAPDPNAGQSVPPAPEMGTPQPEAPSTEPSPQPAPGQPGMPDNSGMGGDQGQNPAGGMPVA